MSGLTADGILERVTKRVCWVPLLFMLDRDEGMGGRESTDEVDELEEDEPRRVMRGGARE